jgi:RNA polymerase sigma-70 factor (ECF subfamily)
LSASLAAPILSVVDEHLDRALDAARSGDEAAVAVLFRAFQPQLLRYLRHYIPDAAEDVASETWLAAARALPRFAGGARDFRALLFAIARRRAVDVRRRRSRRVAEAPLEAAADPAAGDDPAGEAVGHLSAQEAIAQLVADLPPDQAEALLLRVVADLSVEQVAEVMGRSAGAVRVLQHRALRRLIRAAERGEVTR